MITQGEIPPAVFRNCYLTFIVIVIHLNEPTAGYQSLICFSVLLLIDIHTVFIYAYCLGQEIQTDIITVKHNFDRTEIRSPCHIHQFAEIESGNSVFSWLQQCEMLVLRHTHHRCFLVELYLVRFFRTFP